MPGINMDDLVAAFRQIQQQALQPNTIVMHPEVYKDLQIHESYGIGIINPRAAQVLAEQQMTAPTRLQEYMDFKFKDPPVYKDRWQSIMEDEL